MALRAGTRAAHERVDAAFGRFDLRDRAGYAAFLRAHSLVLPSLEAALTLGGAEAVLPDWPERRRTPALIGDLRKLEIEPPQPRPAPLLRTPAERLGTLYVLEGSRLGARLLLGEARQGDDAVRGATDYLAHGEGRGFWPSFLQRLEAQRVEPALAIAAAVAAFAAFEAAAEG